MTTQGTELGQFHQFLETKLADGGKNLTLDEAVIAFREYQRAIQRLRAEIQPALEASLRGESQPFDAEALKARATQELARKGITD